MRECFSFYRSFLEAIDKLPPDIQAEIYPAIAHYALNDVTPTSLSPFAECVFTLVKPIIDSNNKKRDNGAKGGAPTGNKNARKKTTKNNPIMLMIIIIYLLLTENLIILTLTIKMMKIKIFPSSTTRMLLVMLMLLLKGFVLRFSKRSLSNQPQRLFRSPRRNSRRMHALLSLNGE